MEDKNMKIVEINGVKIEVDMRKAKQVNTYKVGDSVKVLVKEYESFKVKYGVIVDFADFSALPSIVVAYLDGWNNDDIKYVDINNNSQIEIAPCSDDEIKLDKEGILRKMNKEIEEKESEIREIKEKIRVFNKRFGEIFEGNK